jgi:hypothetical protein
MKRPSQAIINRSVGILAAMLFMALTLTACSDSGDHHDPMTVGPAGGTIKANGVTIVIPAGALDSERKFVISEAAGYPADNNIIGTPIEVDPDIVFKKPVTITLPYTLPGGVNLANASMATVQGGAWSPIPETVVNVSDSTVTASVQHFSTFTPFWYEPPDHELEGYYFSASLDNRPGFAEAGVDNTLYNADGKTASFGNENTGTGTWTPYSYTMRADGLLQAYYTTGDETVHELGIANLQSKVQMYFQPSVVDTSSFILFGFEKPAADYLPSLVGSQYFAGGYQSSTSDTAPLVFADQISFDTATAGHITRAESEESSPFTYVVEAGGMVTMTVTDSNGTTTWGFRLNGDASLLAYGYSNTGSDTVGLVVGARLSAGKSNADLSGTFHTVLYQPDQQNTRVSYRTMTFDGQGGGTFVTYDEHLDTPVATGTLTYAMHDDGTFTLNLVGLSEGFDEPSVLSADGNVFVNPDSYGTRHTYTIGVKKTVPAPLDALF